MSLRAVMPLSRQLRGVLPDCGPYYDQETLPLQQTPGSIPAVAAPVDSRNRFHQFNSIVCPAAGTTLALITSYTVPDGHQSSVVGLLVDYEGTGWVQGDPALILFALRLNGAQFVRNYDKIPNQLGSFAAGPWPLPGKLKLSAADLLEILVTVPGGSTIGTGGTNRVHGHLVGYETPQQG